MSIYTEFVLACELKPGVSQQVIDTLAYFMGEIGDVRSGSDRVHPLFTEPRYYAFLLSDSGAFAGGYQSVVRYDDISGSYHLAIRINLKDYGEFEKFLYWIAPYSVSEGFVGYRYAEIDDAPTLIYFREEKAFLVETKQEQQVEITPEAFRNAP